LARKRREYSAQERRELWERWKRGESISEIGRALDRAPGTIHDTIRQHGGVAPPQRRRSRFALTLQEREEISRGVAAGDSARRIASRLGRSPSTIARELGRHGGRRRYRAAEADRRTWERARRPQRCKLARHPVLSRIVAAKLREEWSPEQIAGWLKIEFPHDETMWVSHETIYLTPFIQARGALKRELVAHLRRTRSIRRPRTASRVSRGQGQIVDAVSIRERPAEAADRAIPGHWEGDLLAGAANSHVATLVERHSRFVMLWLQVERPELVQADDHVRLVAARRCEPVRDRVQLEDPVLLLLEGGVVRAFPAPHGLKADAFLAQQLAEPFVGDVVDHPLGDQVVGQLGQAPGRKRLPKVGRDGERVRLICCRSGSVKVRGRPPR